MRVRLLPLLATSQALGIWIADRSDWPVESAIAMGGTAIVLGTFVCRTDGTRAVASCAIALALGAHLLGARIDAARSARPAAPTDVTIEANVERVASGPGWTRAVWVDGIDVEAGRRIGRVEVFDGGFGAEPSGLGQIAPGTRVRARLRIRPVRSAANPGSNSRTRAMERAGVAAVARLAHPSLIVSESDRGTSVWLAWLHGLRARISAQIAATGPGSEVIRSLAVGDRSDLRTESRDAFRRLGLSHLLAISGLHLALVGSFGFAMMRAIAGRSAWLAARGDTRLVALFAGLLAATVYAWLAGFGVPVRRALILLMALAMAFARGRASSRAEPLAVAAMAVLSFSPDALFDAGAQLSFAAATALAYSLPREVAVSVGTRFERLRLAGVDSMRASASAIAATAPLAAWHFGSAAPLAPLANLIAIPWTGLVLLPVALGAALAAGVGFMPPAVAASALAARSLRVVETVAERSPVWVPVSEPAPIWMWTVAVLVFATVRSRRTVPRIAGALAVGAVLVVARPVALSLAPPRMLALDVGQGSSTIVQDRRTAVLFDGGGASSSGDWGQRAIVPALRALSIDRLDLVIVSHGDLDHRGGIPSVLERIDVREVWIPFGARAAPEFGAILEAARVRDIPVTERGAGSLAVFGDGLRVEGLWPQRSNRSADRNDRSIVVRIEVSRSAEKSVEKSSEKIVAGESVRILLPGDISRSVESELVARGVDLRADVLALAHHGSRTSSTDGFLTAVGAGVAIASAPLAGRFGMPHPEVLERARAAHTSVWWTGLHGAVWVGLARPLTAWGHRPPD